MEQLAKIGIVITNIGIAIAVILFTVFLYGFLGFTGTILALIISVCSVTTWAMMVSAYSKFMNTK